MRSDVKTVTGSENAYQGATRECRTVVRFGAVK